MNYLAQHSTQVNDLNHYHWETLEKYKFTIGLYTRMHYIIYDYNINSNNLVQSLQNVSMPKQLNSRKNEGEVSAWSSK